jgi:hypothetical protein
MPLVPLLPELPLEPELPLLPELLPLEPELPPPPLDPTVLVSPPHDAATVAAAAASVVVNANAAARVNRLLAPGIVVTEPSGLLQNGHVFSSARTWRAHEGQGPSAGGM